jgi:acetylornithine deacetylase/succinyl-diaminopimelate desuccinylase-like protein
MQLDPVHQQIRQDFESKHLNLIQRFLRQPSVSNEGIGMAEMAELVAMTIRDLGGSARVAPTAGWPIVHGRIDVGAPRTLLLYGMYDVQPANETDWLVPPFSGAIREMGPLGPCIVSRGATNSKGPLAGFFNTLYAIRAAGEPLPVNVIFIVEGEEEMGSRHLPDFIAEHADELRSADGAYFPAFRQPIHGDPIVQLGTKGLLYLELTCQGGDWGGPRSRGVHGAYSAWFASPAWKLVQALASLKEGERVTVEDFYNEVWPPSAADESALADLAIRYDLNEVLEEHDVARFKYDLPPHDLLRQYIFQPVLNIDGINGGYTGPGTKTLLPHQVTAKVDIRMVPNMDADTTVARLRRHLDRHGFADVEIKMLNNYPWSKLEPDHPLAQTVLEAYRWHGFQPLIWPMNPGSAPFFLFYETLGVPYALGGLGHGERAHSSNELCTVEGLRLFEEWVATFMHLFARGNKGS